MAKNYSIEAAELKTPEPHCRAYKIRCKATGKMVNVFKCYTGGKSR